MYQKLEDRYISLIKKVSEYTLTNYSLEGEFFNIEDWKEIVEDLLIEIINKDKEINNLKKDMEENYKKIPISEQI